ncbi:MAG TPA: adenosylcobinamide-GDP ribazoletransferase [Vicinamibacterales bacterium]|nr:adenosylcobinamide-GDP ribazoletransferase [Vicinamibacterales bacterium]
MLTAALAAFAILTRVPIRRSFSPSEISTAAPFFPLVGALIGALQAFFAYLLTPFLPSTLLAAGLLAIAALATGGLHLDGLADMSDGFGGGSSREDVLRIMRDSNIGAFGAVSLVLILLIRASAISTLIDRRAAVSSLVLAPMLGRWTMVALPYALRYARPEGGLGAVVSTTTSAQLAVTTVIAALLSFAIAGPLAVGGWLVAVLVTLAAGSLAFRRIGGYTGDILGANNELTEAAVLVAGVVLTR